MRIITAPHQVLSEVARPIKTIDKELLSFIEDMKQTLLKTRDPQGVGLAAPQVGRSVRIFITKPTDNSPISIFINPIMNTLSNDLVPVKRPKKSKHSHKLEGCLSLPSIWGFVLRSPKVKVEFMDETGRSYTKTFTGFMATIIQHEMDHLDGILFPKRVLEQKQRLFKSHKDKKGEDIFDEIEL